VKRKWGYSVGVTFTVVACLITGCDRADRKEKEPIKVGLLYSSTGALAPYEKPVMEATLLAIEEINAAGGVLKRPLAPIVADGASKAGTFAREAEVLIQKKGASVIFGGSCLYCRRKIKFIVERYKHLLFYPYPYVGTEISSNIVYCGESASQRIVPAISWLAQNLGTRFFIVGSDNRHSRIESRIIKDQVYALKGTIVGEAYITEYDGEKALPLIVDEIRRERPNVILNTVTGAANALFFQELRNADIYPEDVPSMIFNLSEGMLSQLDSVDIKGNYTIGSYFPDIKTPENKKLKEAFQRKYGKERLVDGMMEAAYFSVYLWAQAVEESASHIPQKVLSAIGCQSFVAPSGFVYIDPETQTNYKRVRIGKIGVRGQYEIVWDSENSISPRSYSPSHFEEEEGNGDVF